MDLDVQRELLIRPECLGSGLSPETRRLCQEIVTAGENGLTAGRGLVRFARGADSPLWDPAYQTVSPEDRAALDRLVSFYMHRMEPPVNKARTLLRSNPEWAQRLARYDSRTAPPVRLNPPPCPNAADLERHDLEVPGLASLIPVFRSRLVPYPWPFLESDLLIAFEILKVFFPPEALEAILVPPSRSTPMALYVAGPASEEIALARILSGAGGLLSDPVLAACGIQVDDRAGEYDWRRNAMMIVAMEGPDIGSEAERLLTRSRGDGVSEITMSTTSMTWRRFFHEMGHALAEHLLERGSRVQVWQEIDAFYHWTRSQMERYPENMDLIPDHTLHTSLIGGSTVNVMAFRQYALRNRGEFFAELVDEHIANSVSGQVLQGPASRARRRIMRDFFTATGPNWNALSRENVEAAYRREGIAMDLSSDRDATGRNEAGMQIGLGVPQLWMTTAGGLGLGASLALNSGSERGISIGLGLEGILTNRGKRLGLEGSIRSPQIGGIRAAVVSHAGSRFSSGHVAPFFDFGPQFTGTVARGNFWEFRVMTGGFLLFDLERGGSPDLAFRLGFGIGSR